MWLDFEQSEVTYEGVREFADANGGDAVGRVAAVNGGRVAVLKSDAGRGLAVRFPRPCLATQGCPRALVEVAHSPDLDPAAASFSYGASVLLKSYRTSTGSNVLQKGRFGSAGGQWKLQVDTLDGKASCVVRSGTSVLSVRSPVVLADGLWHQVTCRKEAASVSIDVDGTVRRRSGRLGSVSNQYGIRIGSAGLGDGDDQFHGVLDDVFLTVDER
jgi:hypothetical protein